MKTVAFVALTVSLFVGLDRFFHQKEKTFQNNFYPCFPGQGENPSPEVEKILDQPFTYFNKGSQSYVFLSQDKKYVLKLFKKHKLTPISWLSYLSIPANPYHQDFLKKQQRIKNTFLSCQTANDFLKEETGLVYLHLHPTKLCRSLHLIDKKGCSFQIPLDDTLFFIQRKAELIYPTISQSMALGKVEKAKEIITAVFAFLEHLGKKGVAKNDPIIKKNFGILEDKVVQIDIGNMAIEPIRLEQPIYKTEISNIVQNFKKWLMENYPELIPHFERIRTASSV